MSDGDTSNAAWQGFIDKWLAVQPQQRVALVFVDGHRHPGHIALAALEQELLDAAPGEFAMPLTHPPPASRPARAPRKTKGKVLSSDP